MTEAPERVLITGGTGFLGRACVERLVARGDEAYVLSRSVSDMRGGGAGATRLQCDLRDEGGVRSIMREVQPTRLLHLAWHVRAAEESTDQYQASATHDEWVGISASLFAAFAEEGAGGHIATTGSALEYGSPMEAVREDDAVAGQLTRYAAAKRATQAELSRIAQQAQLDWSWARLFPLYGGGESAGRLLARTTRALLRHQPVRFNHSRYIRDLVLVDDAANALVLLLGRPANAVLNIGSGIGHNLREVLTELATMIGAPELVSFDGSLTNEHDSEPAVLVADVERERRMIGFVPSTPLAQGLARTIGYWRERVHDG